MLGKDVYFSGPWSGALRSSLPSIRDYFSEVDKRGCQDSLRVRRRDPPFLRMSDLRVVEPNCLNAGRKAYIPTDETLIDGVGPIVLLCKHDRTRAQSTLLLVATASVLSLKITNERLERLQSHHVIPDL